MKLLLDEDYEEMLAAGVSIEEDLGNRFLIFKDWLLPEGMYTVPSADVLVVIPTNYNQGGNDMFWTYPRLLKQDGQTIINTNDPGGGDNRTYRGREFCRWSRHWFDTLPSRWRPGRDNAMSIFRRIDDALRNPHRP